MAPIRRQTMGFSSAAPCITTWALRYGRLTGPAQILVGQSDLRTTPGRGGNDTLRTSKRPMAEGSVVTWGSCGSTALRVGLGVNDIGAELTWSGYESATRLVSQLDR